jgi:hypothetical protein
MPHRGPAPFPMTETDKIASEFLEKLRIEGLRRWDRP